MNEKLFALGKPCFYLAEMEISPFQGLTLQLPKSHPLHVLFQCTKEHRAGFSQRLATAQVQYEILQL